MLFRSAAAADPDLLGRPLRLLDLGCGNLRFERFLAERSAGPLSVIALDNCGPLVAAGTPHADGAPRTGAEAEGGRGAASRGAQTARPAETAQHVPAPAPVTLEFRSLDIADALIDDDLERHLPLGTCDMAAAFGFMHHLASPAQRRALLDGLAKAVHPGGFLLVSFWQFLRDGRIAAKAAAVTDRGRETHGLPAFAPGDYLLGWQHAEGVYRFCHHATDGEIDGLIAGLSLPCREIIRFSADGKRGDLNRYVVLQRLL